MLREVIVYEDEDLIELEDSLDREEQKGVRNKWQK